MNAKLGLAANALGLGESMVMGIAGTAPAFSVAATTATLIAAVGVLSPASLLYSGLIMFGVTLAFKQLNRVDPNAGASYAWVEKTFGPVLGFLAGWSLLVATALFMVGGTVPAATATLDLIAPRLTANPQTPTSTRSSDLPSRCHRVGRPGPSMPAGFRASRLRTAVTPMSRFFCKRESILRVF